MATMPAMAKPEARLVHCGRDTCLRISGQRTQADEAIWIEGHELAVAGGRSWRAVVPLAMARGWGTPSGDVMTLALVHTPGKIDSLEKVVLPPGAPGRRVELATLVVRAR